ncbi:MAG: TcpE family conjugal transfer membrane protein [Streptosporangiaceae bacterium]
MDLPTYTSIWRIEKRLYKLYDFRLPMPLPIGQVAVFAGVAVPYVVLLTVLGLPFNHTLIWLYVLPPGLATWLVTRPVLESKRLPELIKSQVRYLAEPRILCRMAPLSEHDIVLVVARVWRPRAGSRSVADSGQTPQLAPSLRAEVAAEPVATHASLRREPLPAGRSRDRARAAGGSQATPVAVSAAVPPRAQSAVMPAEFAARAKPAEASRLRIPAHAESDQAATRADAAPSDTAPTPGEAADRSEVVVRPVAAAKPDVVVASAGSKSVVAKTDAPRAVQPQAQPVPEPPDDQPVDAAGDRDAPAGPPRPVVTVIDNAARTTPPSVERALAGPSARRGDLRGGRVSVVPGGHRPGKPDMLQRDRARAKLPIGFKPRIVVLGCTVGAGQTMTTLLTGELLAGLRPDQVAVMDLNSGPGSLARRAEARPAPSQAALTGRSRLVVIGPRGQGSDPDGTEGLAADVSRTRDPAADAIAFEAATDRYDLVIADPATIAVPKLLAVADQLVLVAPASGAAPGAIAMTFEWLEAHGQSGLAAGSIMVLNGVSRRSVAATDQAERVCAGRCRAVVKIPWDDQVQGQIAKRALPAGPSAQLRQHWAGVLSPPTAAAYTALAGILVASLSQEAGSHREPQHAGQARQ